MLQADGARSIVAGSDRRRELRVACENCVYALTNVVSSLCRSWTPDPRGGWRELPTPTLGTARVDVWSTAQALELIACSSAHLVAIKEQVTGDLVSVLRRALIAGAPVLLADPVPRAEGPGRRDQACRDAGGNGSVDNMALIWKLRAMAEVATGADALDIDLPRADFASAGEAVLESLLASQRGDGGWAAFGWGGNSSYATAMAVWAIARFYEVFEVAAYLRPHKVHSTHLAVEWLLGRRLPDAGLPYFELGRTSVVSRTALAQVAVAARKAMLANEPVPELDVATMSAWLLDMQHAEGGWRDHGGETTSAETEVTALALLGLLEAGVAPQHPAVAAAVALLLRSQRHAGTAVGWGVYLESTAEDGPRIWTTWCAVLAMWQFVRRAQRAAPGGALIAVTRAPRVIPLLERGERTMHIAVENPGPEAIWAVAKLDGVTRIACIARPLPVKLESGLSRVPVRVRATGVGNENALVVFSDLQSGNTHSSPIRIVCAGGLAAEFIRCLGEPSVLLSAVVVSAAVYGASRARISVSAALGVGAVGLLAIVLVVVFAAIRYITRD